MPEPVASPKRLHLVAHTRRAIVDSAELHFIRNGFHHTSLQSIASSAGFTKGAVYRHFRDKVALFLEVFDRVEQDTLRVLERPAVRVTALDDSVLETLALFLAATTQTRFRRIVLEEGPSALGWRRWRELDQNHTARYLDPFLMQLMAGSAIKVEAIGSRARLCHAAIREAAILVGETDEESRPDVEARVLETLRALLSGLSG